MYIHFKLLVGPIYCVIKLLKYVTKYFRTLFAFVDWGRGGAGKVRKRLPSWNAFSCDLEKAECSDLQASTVKHMVSCHLTDQYYVPAPACVPVCSVVFKVVMTDTRAQPGQQPRHGRPV